MKRSYHRMLILLLLLLLCMTCMTACTNTKEAEMSAIPQTLPPIESSEVVTQEKESVPVLIYYGNQTADGLVTEEKQLLELTPEVLIEELAKKNIVSLDTKVRGFQIVEKDGQVILDLNLSKEFADYVGMMGTAGEYIVLAGLTNTFLDAYAGDSLVLNCNGIPLETGHNSYTEPFTKYSETNKEIVKSYELVEEKQEEGIVNISYPQFQGMEDTDFMQKWNTIIKEQAIGNFNQKGLLSYEIEYEIATQDVDLVSIILRGTCNYENAAYPFRFAKTLTIDLKNGKNKRLAEYAEIESIVKRLEEGTGFSVLSEGITPKDIQSYMQTEYVEDFSILLFDYDYDDVNKSLIPTGYSYVKDNKTVLIVNVMHAMGDYVELQMD